MVIINKLIVKDNSAYNKYGEIDYKNQEYISIINIYTLALNRVEEIIVDLQKTLNRYSGYEVIQNVNSRIKSYDSIVHKMKKKKLEYKCSELIKNINDIAGIRIICISEEDIYKVVKILSNFNEFNIIKEKDYVKKHKKSGYSAYHMIIEIPIHIEEKEVWVKVEIQIRTVAMDFWSNLEHKVKYKSNTKISKKNSNRLKMYAKIISIINKDMVKMYKRNYKYIES